jgi:hypothetical protein
MVTPVHPPPSILVHCISPAISFSTPTVLLISLGRLCRNKCLPVSFASRVSFVLELWRDVSSLWVPRDVKWHGSSLSVHDAARPWGPGRLGNAMATHTLSHSLTHTHTQKYYLEAALWTSSRTVVNLPSVSYDGECNLNSFPLVIPNGHHFLSLGFHGVRRHRNTFWRYPKQPESNPNVRPTGPTQACRNFLSSLRVRPRHSAFKRLKYETCKNSVQKWTHQFAEKNKYLCRTVTSYLMLLGKQKLFLIAVTCYT